MIPEIHLLNLLKSLWDQLARDYKTHNGDRNRTLLGAIFPAGSKIDDWDFYEQTGALLEKRPKTPGALRLALGYTLNPEQVPSGHLLLPGESPSGAPQGLGLQEQTYYDPRTDPESEEYEGPGPLEDEMTPLTTYSRSYQATYNLMLVAGNSLEAVALHRTFKALLLAAHPSLEAAGFQNLSIGGAELRLEEEQAAPSTLFSRVISLTFFYSDQVPAMFQPGYASRLRFDGAPLA